MGLNPLLVEIEFLFEYDRVLKTARFDTNFMVLVYSVLELRSSVISTIFWKLLDFKQFGPFVRKIIDGIVSSKIVPRESTFRMYFIPKL